MKLINEIVKGFIVLTIGVALYQSDQVVEMWNPPYAAQVREATNTVRNTVAVALMTESEKEEIGKEYATLEIAKLQLQLETAELENMRLTVAINNAIIPESTFKEAAVNHIVTPVKDGFSSIKAKASNLWDAYGIHSSTIKGWMTSGL